MFVQYGIIFLLTPLPRLPKPVHFLGSLLSIVIRNHLAKFIHLLYSLHTAKQSEYA